MNVRFAKDDFGLLPSGAVNFSRAPAPVRSEKAHGILARIASWFDERRRRGRVMDELSMLSDRELADIGLTRAEIPLVFDPEFVAAHQYRRETAYERLV
jgi:uncharacterized protein YjiS (DUF1127 family)